MDKLNFNQYLKMKSYTYKAYHLRGGYASLFLNSVTDRRQIIQEGMCSAMKKQDIYPPSKF
jgi:hypothetical protein